jgi:hypothetical protein
MGLKYLKIMCTKHGKILVVFFQVEICSKLVDQNLANTFYIREKIFVLKKRAMLSAAL